MFYCRRNSSSSKHTKNDSSQSTAASGYHGITMTATGKWNANIRKPNDQSNRIYLGTYQTPEMAAAAYDVAALAFKGKYAVLNFPDAIFEYMFPENSTDDDIYAAAARAAAARSPAYEHGGGSMTVHGDTTPPRMYVDEEAELGMTNLLSDMAQGMLISPPKGDSNSQDNNTYYSGGGSLWDYGH